MFEAGTGVIKGFIEGILFRLIGDGKSRGVERNAKIAYRADRAKAKAKRLAAHAAHRAAQHPPKK